MSLAKLLVRLFVILASLSAVRANAQTTATRTNDFLNSIGINTQVQSYGSGAAYTNGSGMVSDLNYIGARVLRDGSSAATSGAQLSAMTTLAAAGFHWTLVPTNGGGSPPTSFTFNQATTIANLKTIDALSSPHALLDVEEFNEPGNWTPTTSCGTSWTCTATADAAYYTAAKADSDLSSLPVWSITEAGAQTTNTGMQFLSNGGTNYANTFNIHIYPYFNGAVGFYDPGSAPLSTPSGNHDQFHEQWDQDFGPSTLHGYAGNAETVFTSGSKVITEFGLSTSQVNARTKAVNTVNGYLDAYFTDGFQRAFAYELYEEGDGYGFETTTNSPTTVATYMHNLTSVIADTGSTAATFTPASLTYALSGMPANSHSHLMQKSNGHFELALWVDTTNYTLGSGPISIGTTNATLSLSGGAAAITVYDSTSGTTATQTLASASTATIPLSDHAVIVDILPASAAPPAPAVAAGLTSRVFGPAVTIGSGWYSGGIQYPYLGKDAIQNSDGSVTVGSVTGGAITTIQSATGPTTYTGSVWTGSQGPTYMEVTMSIGGGAINTANGWPAWWANDVEIQATGACNPTSQWQGQASNYCNWIENDIAEFAAGGQSTCTGNALHNWYGAVGSGLQTNTNFGGACVASGSSINVSHRYGFLWTPATSTTQGSARYYIDDVLTNSQTWNQYNPATGPPPVAGSTAYSVMDARHMYQILSGSPANPLHVTAASVWQKAAGASFTESANDTTITTVGPVITDANGNTFAISSGGQILINGVADTATSNVTELAYVSHVVWQENTSGNWYSYGGSPGSYSAATTTSPLPGGSGGTTGSTTPAAWTAYDVSYPGVTLACGKPFHFIVAPPPSVSTSIKYPLYIWLHPDYQGDPWYYGGNTDPLALANDEAGNFNTTAFQARYPAYYVAPSADQTNGNGTAGSCTGDGNDAVQNWGGWTNNGSTGSGTHYSGDSGPNTYALVAMVKDLEGRFPQIDPNRIYINGFSLGGIYTDYACYHYNAYNGDKGKIFAACAGSAGVNEADTPPSSAAVTALKTVPQWMFSGANDTASPPSGWNTPLCTALGGTPGNLTAITSATANQCGTSAMRYTLCPTCGHQDTDASGNPVWTNQTINDFLFAQSATGAVVTPPVTPPATGTGQFLVKNGQIYDPKGNLYIPVGINLDDSESGYAVTNAQGQPLTTLMPGINHIRLVTHVSNNEPLSSGATYPDPTAYDAVVNALTPLGIVVEIDDHDCNGGYVEYNSGADASQTCALPQPGSAALTPITNWYTAMAKHFASNPYVWFSSMNEPCSNTACDYATSSIALISNYQQAIYNAVRTAGGSGAMMQMLAGLGGGNCGTVGSNGGFIVSDYATMTNIIWELHSYNNDNATPGNNGQIAGSTGAQAGGSGGCGYLAAQTIKSADGTVPVIFGEWGSGDGDPNNGDASQIAANMITAAKAGYGDTGWAWYPSTQWQMANNGDGGGTISLTTWGNQMANVIAKVAPLSGTGGTAPTAGESLSVSAVASPAQNTAFTVSGTISNVTSAPTLQYQDNGGSWTALPAGASVSATAFSFTNPGLASNGSATVAVRDANNNAITATSAPFTVRAPESANNTTAVPTASTVAPTFSDSFSSLSLHDLWQSGDKWQLISPDTPQGRGGTNFGENGDQWWANPYNTSTPISGIYVQDSAGLHLGLLNTPSADQAYINSQSGSTLPYVGGLLNTSQTNYQKYGYWQIVAKVPKVNGFTFQADTECVQVCGVFPPEIDLRIGTNSSGVQTVLFQFALGGGQYTQFTMPTGFDPTVSHTYGWDWESNFITFYVDNVQQFQSANPSSAYTTNPMFLFLVTAANYIANTGDPASGSLPVAATVTSVNIYPSKPGSASGPSATITDANGNTFFITAGGQISINGTVDAATSNVTELAYVNHVLWQENASGNWYNYLGTPGSYGGPTTTSPVTATPAEALTINSVGQQTSNAPFTVTGTISGATASTSTNFAYNPGQDGSFFKQPFQSSANWITSGSLITALRGGTPSINLKGNYAAPWVTGTASDPVVKVTDGTKTINVHIPLGTVIETPTSAYDQSIGGADATQPYLVWSISGATMNTGSVAASGSVITGTYGFAVQDGSGLMMVDAVTGAPGDNNSIGGIQDYELAQIQANPNYVIPHMLTVQLDPSFQASQAGPIWPLQVIDTSPSPSSYLGPIPQGVTIGIPANVPRPTGQTRGFYALWDQLQQQGMYNYNFGSTGGANITIYDASGSYASLISDMQTAWVTIAQNYLSILNYASGVSGAQYSLATTKGAIAGSTDAYPPPPPLDLSTTGGVDVAPSTFGAWYPNTSYTTTATNPGAQSAAPTLQYQDNTGAWQALPAGATITGTTFSFLHPALAAGQDSINIRDANNTAAEASSNTFSVAQASGETISVNQVPAQTANVPFTVTGSISGATGAGTSNAPAQAAAAGYNALTFGPGLVYGNTADPATSHPSFSNFNIGQFSFFGTSWTNIGTTVNSDGSITMDGTGQAYGNGLTTASAGSFLSPPTSFDGEAFGGGFYAEVQMKGTGPMSWWANDLEEMNGGSENWGNVTWPGTSMTINLGCGSPCVAANDNIQLNSYAPWINNGTPLKYNYTTSGSDSLTTIASALAANINSTLSTYGVSASASGSVVTVNNPAGKVPGARFSVYKPSGSGQECTGSGSTQCTITAQASWLEPDIMEFDNTNDYSWAFHNWNGPSGGDISATYGGPLSSCPGGGSTCTWIGPTLNGVTVDFTQYHKYGMLWVPATSSAAGYVQYYFDGTPVSNKFAYNQYSATAAPPPTAGSLGNCQAMIYQNDHNTQVCQFQPSTAWSVLDTRHLVFIFGGSTQGPTTVQSLSVWQANGSGDLPVINAASTGGPPTLQYQDGSGTWQPLPSGATVTATTFSFTHPGLSATSSGTISVRDAANTSVVGASNSFVVNGAAVEALAITAIAGQHANTAFAINGTIANDTAAPSLQYRDNGGAWQALTTGAAVSATAFSFSHPGLAAASSNTVAVRDAANTAISTTSNAFSVLLFESANNSVVTTVGPVIVDATGEQFALNAAGQVTVNGVIDTTTSSVIALAYVNHLVWQENSAHLWSSKAISTAPWSAATATSPLPPETLAVSGIGAQTVGVPFAAAGTIGNALVAPALQYSVSNGPWVAFPAGSQISTTAFSLTIPAISTAGSATLSVRDAGTNSITATSGSFSVAAAPIEQLTFAAIGAQQTNVAFRVTGSIANAATIPTLQYNVNGGSWAGLPTGSPASLVTQTSFAFTVPAIASAGATTIGIRDANTTGITATSNTFQVGTPVGETLAINTVLGQLAAAPFQVSGTIANAGSIITLQYAINGGPWQAQPAGASVTLTTFTVPIPGQAAGATTVSVRDANTTTAVATSNSFQVAPAGNEALTVNAIAEQPVGTAFAISGTIANLSAAPALQYADNGGNFQALPAGSTVTATNFSFIHPGVGASQSLTVVVRDANHPAITAAAPAFIVIARESPNLTTITTQGPQIVDSQGNAWTLTAGKQVALNGVPQASTSNVVEIAYVNRQVWYENANLQWWVFSNLGSWSPTGGTLLGPLPSSKANIYLTSTARLAVVPGFTVAIPGIIVNDTVVGGSFDIAISATDGTVTMPGASGSGSASLTEVGTLSAINQSLSGLQYMGHTVGAGVVSITVTDPSQSVAAANVNIAVVRAAPVIPPGR